MLQQLIYNSMVKCSGEGLPVGETPPINKPQGLVSKAVSNITNPLSVAAIVATGVGIHLAHPKIQMPSVRVI